MAGIYIPNTEYLKEVEKLCKESGTFLIFDEIQSGYGRSGKFFAHQLADVKGDIITMAKGIANGYPMGALIISDKIEAKYGMLGTTFGGNHLGCAAAIAVLDVMKAESLIENSKNIGDYIINQLTPFVGEDKPIKEIRGAGLMIGLEMNPGFEGVRNRLLFETKVFTGGASKNIIRLLPPLNITKEDIDKFIESFKICIK